MSNGARIVKLMENLERHKQSLSKAEKDLNVLKSYITANRNKTFNMQIQVSLNRYNSYYITFPIDYEYIKTRLHYRVNEYKRAIVACENELEGLLR